MTGAPASLANQAGEPPLGSTQVQSSSPLLKPGSQFIKCLCNGRSALLENICEWCGEKVNMDPLAESLRKKHHNYSPAGINAGRCHSRLGVEGEAAEYLLLISYKPD